MPDYQPTSRRPIAGVFRQTASGAVNFCVRAGIHPDMVSYASIVASAIAGACFWQSYRAPWVLLILAPGFCYLRLWFNMLDGMVAIASGKASLRGEILNDLPDRLSDALIFAGVAHSGLCHIYLGYWGAIGALLVAYVGMFGQAVGGKRDFSGIMAKPYRMVALHVGAWLALILRLCCGGQWCRIGPFWIMDWTLIIIILGCVQSIWVRLAHIMKALEEKKKAS